MAAIISSSSVPQGLGDLRSEHVVSEVRRHLSSAGYRSLRQVECDYFDGVLVLRGHVPSYYHKQVAQTTLLNDPAIKTIINQIEVHRRHASHD